MKTCYSLVNGEIQLLNSNGCGSENPNRRSERNLSRDQGESTKLTWHSKTWLVGILFESSYHPFVPSWFSYISRYYRNLAACRVVEMIIRGCKNQALSWGWRYGDNLHVYKFCRPQELASCKALAINPIEKVPRRNNDLLIREFMPSQLELTHLTSWLMS